MDIIKFPESDQISKDVRIGLAKERLKQNFERRSKTQKALSRVSLREGDLVLLHVPKQSDAIRKITRKFFHLYYGSYLIIKDFGNASFKFGGS